MKRTVVLAATAGPAVYAALVAALAEAGRRVGWLELGATPAGPAGLEAAAAAGALRAVAAARGRVLTVKPTRGEPVLDDLLREHFRGCLLVLARGAPGLPALSPAGDGWRLEGSSGAAVERSTAELVASLGRPARWRRLIAGLEAPAG